MDLADLDDRRAPGGLALLDVEMERSCLRTTAEPGPRRPTVIARKKALAVMLAALLTIGGVACEPVGEEDGGTDAPAEPEEGDTEAS